MASYNAIRYDIPAPTPNLLAIYVRYRGQTVSPPVAYLTSGYLDTSLGKPAQGGSGTPRPLTGWLWPRT